MSQLRLFLLGPPRIERDGILLQTDTRKATALLAYLAVTDESYRRDALVTLLWPDYDSARGLAALRRTLSDLRKTLAGSWLDTDRETIGLQAGADLWLDVDRFHRCLEQCRAHGHLATEVCPACLSPLAEAAALYRGDFLAGFSLRDSLNFDDWQFYETDLLRREFAGALERLARGHSAQGAFEPALRYARQWLALDHLEEEAHAQLMRLYAWLGQRSAALRQYEQCVQVLDDQLGMVPQPSTTALYSEIQAGRMPGRPASAPSPPGPVEEESKSSPAPRPKEQAPPVQAHAMVPELHGERRWATVLVAEVKGSTALAEPVDIEAWVDIMNHMFRWVALEIQRYSGHIDQFRGDGLVALFGMPQAHEDDAERAVLAALAIQEAVKRHVAELEREAEAGLQLRIGLNTGEVITATAGDEERHGEATAMGQAVALAARVAAAAEPGTVLVSERTYRLVEPLFEWQPPGERVIKGVSQPLAGRRPVAARVGVGKARGVAGFESPLVGRAAELRVLEEAVARLRAGIGGIVTLVGEAGVGKSRLVAEVRKSLPEGLPPYSGPGQPRDEGQEPQATEEQGEGIWWLEGRCMSYGAAMPYQLWVDMLRNVLGLATNAGPDVVSSTLRERVLSLRPAGMDDVYPYLGRLLSVPLSDELEARLSGLDAERLKAYTFRAAEALVEGAARQRPLAIVCEDLHWADPTSLELLEHLLPLTDGVPLLLICILRPETEHSSWRVRELAERRYRHRYTALWLEPLSAAESALLLDNLLGSVSILMPGGRQPANDLPYALREHILRLGEGNPFFVEEILRALVDSGIVVCDEVQCRWQAAADDAAIALPNTLHGVLMARIDRLPSDAKRVLQLAAVVGRIFTYRVLSAVAAADPPRPPGAHPGHSEGLGVRVEALEAHLLTLQRAQMIRERARVPEQEYIFKHVLTQEAAYDSLLRRERRTLHRQIAVALEQVYAGRIEEHLGLLAHHWERAGEGREAIPYLRCAGEQARRGFANEEAISYFRRALDLLQAVPHTPDRDRQEADLLLAMGVPLVLTRGHGAPEVEATYARARTLCAQAGASRDLFQALLGLRRFYLVRGDLRTARDVGEQLISVAQAMDDPGSLSRAHGMHGETLYWLGAFLQAQEHYERGMALYDPRRARDDTLRYGNDLGILFRIFWALLLWQFGYPDQALRSVDEALALAQERPQPFNLTFAPWQAAIFHQLRREAPAVREQAEAVIRQASESGFSFFLAWGRFMQGWALAACGQVEAGIAQMHESMAAIQATGARAFQSYGLALLAELHVRVGKAAEALRLADEALALLEETGERCFEAELYRLRGELLSGKGEQAQAKAAFQRAIDVARGQCARSWELRAATSLARLWHEQGKRDKARDLLQPVYDWFTEGFDTADLRDARELLEALSQQ